jgi:hypothetical protein
MCRSSTTSIGFLLLLWLGVVVPAAEQQLAHLADDPGATSGIDAAAAGDDGASGDAPPQANASDVPDNPDLCDISVHTTAPQVTPVLLSPSPARVADRVPSRHLPPQERPPKPLAA